nr:hypothetical protein [Tanacetum cinerariifolium]GEY49196.1 hypothetical protein [Tanacetum cinerariifolium]
MGDENPIRTLGDYSKPSHEGYRNTIKLPVGNKVCEIDRAVGRKLRNKNTNESWEIIENLALYNHEGWGETKEFVKPVKAIATPQGILKTPDQRPHTEKMGRFKNAIFKQREEINGRMTEMFRLLKELTTNRTPEKVLIRKEAKFTVTKNVNSISLTKGEEEGCSKTEITPKNIEKHTETKTKIPVKEAEIMNEAENRAGNKSIKTPENEEAVQAPGSQPVAYYLKHKINEKLINGLVDNNKFNNSLLGTRVGKKNGKTYKVLPRGLLMTRFSRIR